jgi:Protein of unknown function (DUF1275)
MNQDGAVRDLSRAMLVPFVLSVIAGSVDVIGFLGLDGLFIAHITGNLVVLAARSVAGEEASVAHSLSVPVFVMALATASLAAAGLARLSNPCLFGTQIPQNRLAAVRTCRNGIGSTMAVSRCRRGCARSLRRAACYGLERELGR